MRSQLLRNKHSMLSPDITSLFSNLEHYYEYKISQVPPHYRHYCCFADRADRFDWNGYHNHPRVAPWYRNFIEILVKNSYRRNLSPASNLPDFERIGNARLACDWFKYVGFVWQKKTANLQRLKAKM